MAINFEKFLIFIVKSCCKFQIYLLSAGMSGWLGLNDKTNKIISIKLCLENLIKITGLYDFNKKIIVRGQDVFIESEGVPLSVEGTNRYFKSEVNEGSYLLQFLKRKGLGVIDTMVDVGAAFGEISLYFAKNFQEAKILAIEPSTSNFGIMKKNLQEQSFNVNNIILENLAISDKTGKVDLSTELKSENTIILNEENPAFAQGLKTESVKADTLENILKKHRINEIDFLKIDIEGAEPLLLPSVKKYSDRIKAIFIEFGSKRNYMEYLPFIDALYAYGFKAYVDEHMQFDSASEARKYYLNYKIEKNNKSINFWFIS